MKAAIRNILFGTKPVIPLVLDTLSASFAAAYSLRLLRAAYTGFCIRVRRSSDNTEQDIGFASGVLDTATLLAFVGAGEGFVATWYDQSVNALHMTQSTAALQPKIVSAWNSLSCLLFDSVDDVFFNSGIISSTNNFTFSAVFEFMQATQYYEMVCGSRQGVNASTAGALLLQTLSDLPQFGCHNTDAALSAVKVDVTTRLEKRIASLKRSGGTLGNGGTVTVRATNAGVDVQTIGTQDWNSAATNGFQIGGKQHPTNTSFGSKRITEIIVFASALNSSDTSTLEANQKTYYGIS